MSDPQGPWRTPPRPPPPAGSGPPRRPGLWLWLGLLAGTLGLIVLAAGRLPAQGRQMDWTEALRLLGILALVSSGLVSARRVDLGRTARMIAGWAAIFAVAICAYAFKDDLVRVGARLRSALLPASASVEAGAVVIGRSDDGGFYVDGEVNGAPVRFLIDTGATDTTLSPADAERAGLDPARLPYVRPAETANGVGYGAFATVSHMSVGPIGLSDVEVSINRAPMSSSLLGMSFLKRLDSFEVRGDRLFLRPRP